MDELGVLIQKYKDENVSELTSDLCAFGAAAFQLDPPEQPKNQDDEENRSEQAVRFAGRELYGGRP